jgi:hypothetical protein
MGTRQASNVSRGGASSAPRTAAVLLLLVVTIAAVPALPKEAETCVACHADGSVGPAAKLDAMDSSVHGSLDCTVCHPGAAAQPHDAATVKASCAACHSSEESVYEGSAHGKARASGEKEAATCTSCHGQAHAIRGVKDPQSTVYQLNLPKTCSQCHSAGKLPAQDKVSVTNPFELYTDSIHGKAVLKSGLLVSASCVNCHGAHDIQAKADPASLVNHANVPATCGTCHAGILSDYAASSHFAALKAGNAKAPVCSDCHTAHQIGSVESAKAINSLIAQCSTCHASQTQTFRDTFHGKVTQLGDLRVASCASCHGAHLVLPASDPRSPTAPANLTATCQKCHPGATASFTEYKPHAEYKDPTKSPGLYAVYILMTVLLLGVFAFFGAHTVLWLAHSIHYRVARRKTAEKEHDDVR